MTDIVSPSKRSKMMSGIRARDTGPEMKVRRLLHRRGYRFRLHRKDLPGSPDIVLAKYRVAVFVHGCFWHWHTGCCLAKLPGTREEFWRAKLQGNKSRDETAVRALLADGWRVLVVWECWLRGCRDENLISGALSLWMESGQPFGEFSGVAGEVIG